MDYDINDINTLQTHSSSPIALNNKGQILGWYNIDGSSTGKHMFVRDRDGSFHELPSKENENGRAINWRFLTDDGKAYGTHVITGNCIVLYMWDQQNGLVNLGNLPGNIHTVNSAGQALIGSIADYESGSLVYCPAIWENGKITKLRGLEGDMGIESEESSGLDMNNKGEVVGHSIVNLSYKNTLYKQTHAVKWINGKAIDLHREIPKSSNSTALAINERGDVLLHRESTFNHDKRYLLKNNGSCLSIVYGVVNKMNNKGITYCSEVVVDDEDGSSLLFSKDTINFHLKDDFDSIWMNLISIVKVNDNGEIIATGRTIYGENHAMFLVPRKS